MSEPRHRHASCLRVLACLLLIGLLGWMPAARAGISCSPTNTSFQLPNFGNIIVPASMPPGTPIGPQVKVTISFTCDGVPPGKTVSIVASNFGGIDYGYSAPANAIMFKTSVTGIDLELTASPLPTNWNGNSVSFADTISAPSGSSTETVTGRLIKTQTGAVAAGSLTSFGNAALIGTFEDVVSNGNGGNANLNSTLSLAGGTVISAPTCAVSPANFTVQLPVLFTSTFQGTGTTAGRTPFAITLNCPTAGTRVSISMTSAKPDPTITGLTDPTGAGYAQGVGVQLLDGGGTTPVDVKGMTQTESNLSSTGAYSIPYYAQYYQTAPSVTGGLVKAVITYTMSYQ